MSKRNNEEILKDIFLRFLAKTEGEVYEVIGEDVSNRAGDRDFDYLLSATQSTKTLALEITLVADNDEDFAYSQLKDLVRERLQETMGPHLPELSGGLRIEIPHYPTGSEIRNLKAVAVCLLDAARFLAPRQEREVETPIGPVEISCIEGDKSLQFCSTGGFGWSTHSSRVSAMSAMLLRRLSQKNDQLDTLADRRVLLIGRMRGTIDRAAIREALVAFEGRFRNIGELYVCYGDDDLERHR